MKTENSYVTVFVKSRGRKEVIFLCFYVLLAVQGAEGKLQE